MGVFDRLRELQLAGERRQAETFAKEALRNEPITVSCEEDRVLVETETFVGQHDLDRPFDLADPEEVRAAVGSCGVYRPADDPDLLKFETSILTEAIVDELVDERPADPRGDSEPEREPEPERGRSPASERSASLIERTVAAVQRLRG